MSLHVREWLGDRPAAYDCLYVMPAPQRELSLPRLVLIMLANSGSVLDTPPLSSVVSGVADF